LDFTDGSSSGVFSKYIRATAQYVADSYFPVVNPIVAGGLTIEGKYTRAPSLFSNSMVSIELLVWFKSNVVKEANISIVDMKVLTKNCNFDHNSSAANFHFQVPGSLNSHVKFGL
jgi:hypothetical protein